MRCSSERLALCDDVAVDVAAVRRLIDEIRTNNDATGPIDAVQTLAGADLLPGWYDDWIVYAQESLAQDRLAALETLARCHLDRGEADGAVRAAGSAIAIEPLRESAHLLLVRGHLLAGNYASAVRAQEHIRSLLWDELGVDLDPLFDEIVARARPIGRTTADFDAALRVRG
jgi:DNA-binding SARP family transcriptional activator